MKLMEPKVWSARPYRIDYYSDTPARPSNYIKSGHAASEVGAVRASVIRLFTKEYRLALVHDGDGVVVQSLVRTRISIEIHFGSTGINRKTA